LRRQLLEKFAAAESTIERISGAIAAASDGVAAAERDLAAYIGSLAL
jgi:hypothetical protein